MPEQETPKPASSLFDTLAGKAKNAVGRLIGNHDLAEEGDLQKAKADAAKDAARAMAEADQRAREAELAAEQDANRLEQQRVQADLARIEREELIERERHAEEAKIVQQAARSHALAAEQAHRDDEMIRQREQDVAATRLDGAMESAAIAQQAKHTEAAANQLEAAQRELERNQTGESS